jgi:hypothetical protein
LSNLKQLGVAWILYANDNDDKLVSSEAGGQWRNQFGEPWVGVTWASGWTQGGQLPEDDQVRGIKAGALWPYVKVVKLYKFPTGYRGELMTYAMMIASNGRSVEGSPVFKKRMLVPSRCKDSSSSTKVYRALTLIQRGIASPSGGISRSRDTVMEPLLPMRMGAPNTTSGKVSKRSSKDVTMCGLGWGSLLL